MVKFMCTIMFSLNSSCHEKSHVKKYQVFGEWMHLRKVAGINQNVLLDDFLHVQKISFIVINLIFLLILVQITRKMGIIKLI